MHVQHLYSSSYQVLIPHLVFLDDFEQVKSIGRCLEKDWRDLLAHCFPKIMVSILPYFALSGQDSQVAQQREKAHRVYDLLKDASCLGKQVNTILCLRHNWRKKITFESSEKRSLEAVNVQNTLPLFDTNLIQDHRLNFNI